MKTTSMLIICDLHSGSATGLTPPGSMTDKYRLTQEPLWKWYTDTAREIGPVDILACPGDLVDGEGKKDRLEQVEPDTEAQAAMAVKCLRQIKHKRAFLCYGTPFHTVGTYNYERPIAEALDCSIAEEQRIEIHGVRWQFRHVVGRSDTAYGQGTPLYKEASRELMHALSEEYDAADYVVRGHCHYYFHVGDHRHHAYSMPCMQIPLSAYGRTCRSMHYHVGMVYVTVRGPDDVVVRPIIMPLKIVHDRRYTKI